jgi:hypothetical protein
MSVFDADAIVLGTMAPPLPFPRFRLGRKDQNVHATVWGRTGSGKSKLLQSVFLQHVAKGHGVGLIEPHHDLSFDCLSSLVASGFFKNERAFDRLVYLDWGNGAYVPFNVLVAREDPHTIALNVLEAMLRVWPELTQAPMFQTLFLSAVVVLIANRLPLTYLFRLLSDPEFRGGCLANIDDPVIIDSLRHYERLGRDRDVLAGSTLRRAFLLMFSPAIRYSLGQPDNWLDFRRIMDEGRAIIINLGNVADSEWAWNAKGGDNRNGYAALNGSAVAAHYSDAADWSNHNTRRTAGDSRDAVCTPHTAAGDAQQYLTANRKTDRSADNPARTYKGARTHSGTEAPAGNRVSKAQGASRGDPGSN